AGPETVIAFDTGPGNMVMDALARRHTRGRQNFDREGKIAARGKVNHELLGELLGDRYYRKKPPKSAGREQYGLQFVERLAATGTNLPGLVATATAFTAATIAAGIRRFVFPVMPAGDLIVSGGGVHNPVLLAYLTVLLPEVELRISSEFGIDADAKEAIAFAILAHESWHARPANLPAATGALHPVVLGKLQR
ncbi:MAG: anhydro-N-acetylmuramic acid kinase, partial [Acidobacteria bacterium]|nr:anhydro-N-acetylmuramic acid kinase [Acidobacteriota bacterium]